MDNKEYVNLLETAVGSHPNAPCEDIVNWRGPGDLKTYEDLDDLVDKITKDEKDTTAAVQEEGKVEDNKDKTNESPLSILENEVNSADEDNTDVEDPISEAVKFTDQESEILNRLINEMNALDTDDMNDDLMDIPDEDMSPLESDEEDLELGVPQEEYELEDLGI